MIGADIYQAFEETGFTDLEKLAQVGQRYVYIIICHWQNFGALSERTRDRRMGLSTLKVYRSSQNLQWLISNVSKY